MAQQIAPGRLVSVEWLADNLHRPELVVLDASMGSAGAFRIPGARAFDFDTRICDLSNALPHMMPKPEHFEREARALGLSSKSMVVIYDEKGIYSSPRARWMFLSMGYARVAILDGGLPAWRAFGGEVLSKEDAESHEPKPGNFSAQPNNRFFCDGDKISVALRNENAVVIDVRSSGRFKGEDPEPRAGLKAGHMPGAVNIPFTSFLTEERYRPLEELKALFAPFVRAEQELFFSCGSGVTACIGAMAAELAGYERTTVYDGSWSEWGLFSSLRPVVTGP